MTDTPRLPKCVEEAVDEAMKNPRWPSSSREVVEVVLAAYNKEVVEPMAKEVEETIRILRERQFLADADCLALVIQRYHDAKEGK